VAQQDFAAFYAATWSDLSGYGHTLTGDPSVGDELAQEAFARVYTRYALLREPRPYAFRILTNLARDRWKSIARERKALEHVQVQQTTPGPDRGILDAVQRLSSGQREAVLLHYWGDMTVEEIASVLRRPSGTVKRWLVQGRAALSETMSKP
jgi:RNA polymerase sigma-70 factor (ECF subfamily)